MIYTVTLNPSIDYIVRLDSLVPGITNRTTAEEYYYGGKGINVSCVLAELDLESTAFGFVAGFVAGYEKTKSYPYALKLGSVCGNATAFLDGLATKEKINELLAKFN